MKKLFGFLALMALVILPIKVSAAASYTREKISGPDANGYYTASIFVTVDEGTTFPGFSGALVGHNALIGDFLDADEFIVDTVNSTKIDDTHATVKTVYKNEDALSGVTYVGTGKEVEVVRFTYKHDPSASADEKCYVSYIPEGETERKIEEPKNPPTGSVLPYVGIAAGIVLIASAYIISKKSTKLYRM